MSEMFEKFHIGDTRQFTVTLSAAPVSGVNFALFFGNSDTLISSQTATQSDATHLYAFYTFVATEGFYRYRFTAPYSPGNVTLPNPNQGLFKVVRRDAP